jgi:hypothetical protein
MKKGILMYKTKGDINKEYNSYEDMMSDVYSECMKTGEAVFINYCNDENIPKKKWWQFCKSK